MNNTETKKKFNIGEFYSKLGPLVALLVLVIFVSVLNSSFLNINNIMNLLQQISVNALIAFGMQFVILTAGIDLSVGSILALSGAFMAQLILMGCPPIFAFAIGMITGAIFGAVNGVLIAYGKAAPFIATLATAAIFRGATYVLTNGNPITPFKSNKYLQVCLFDADHKKHVMGVHTVVAMRYLNYFEGCVVHHLDEDTNNNKVTNLVIMTRREHGSYHAKQNLAFKLSNKGKQA